MHLKEHLKTRKLLPNLVLNFISFRYYLSAWNNTVHNHRSIVNKNEVTENPIF